MEKKYLKIYIISRKTKDGKTFPTYRALTMKGKWFNLVFGKEAQVLKKSGVILIEESNFCMGFKQDANKNYITDKNGNKIPQIFILGEYETIKPEDAPEELKPKPVYDSYKDMF